MIEYRSIELRDVETLVKMTEVFLDESPTYRQIPRDFNKMANLYEAAIFNPTQVFCRVAVDTDAMGRERIVGGMIGAASEYYFSLERMAGDIAVYVEPEFRNSRIAVKLVDSFRQWATDVGCREICIGATTQSHGDGYEKLLNRLGYETVGFVTKKQIER